MSNPRYQLNEIDPVTNCAGSPKPAPAPPVLEIYGSSCYATAHTAGGLSADKRWLFMVINDGKLLPEQLAVFMHINLGVQEALKFDGGGSSALWFKGATELTVNPVSDDRPLSNWMAIHAPAGTGISLPLEATTPERVFTKVRTDGKSAAFKLKFTNTSAYTWMPDDNIGILGPGATSFVGDPATRHLAFKLTKPVPPGKAVEYDWEENAKGLAFSRFQMAQDGEPFGEDVQVIVLTVPQSMQEQADKLQKELDRIVAEAQAKGEEGLNNLVAEVQRWFVKQGQDLLNQLAAEAEKQTQGLLDSLCGATVLPSLPLLGFVLWRRRLRP